MAAGHLFQALMRWRRGSGGGDTLGPRKLAEDAAMAARRRRGAAPAGLWPRDGNGQYVSAKPSSKRNRRKVGAA